MKPIISVLLRSKTAPLLVALQVALSLAILANALYVVNLRQASSSRPSGIADERAVFTVTAKFTQKVSLQEVVAQQKRDVDALRALPGAAAATWIGQMPMSRSGSNSSFSLDRKQARYSAILSTFYAPPGAIKVLGLNLVEGRDLTEDDMVDLDTQKETPAEKWPRTIILTKAAAQFLYPGQSAVGKAIYYGTGDDAQEMRVVGVVDTLQSATAEAGRQGEYSALIPLRMDTTYFKYAVRAEPGQRDRLMTDAETALRNASPTPRILFTRSTEEDRNNRYRNERSLAWMLIAVSALLLLVTASGIVGMTVLRVAQRRKQIGVRRALGARKRDIVRYFVAENLIVTTIGIVLGAVLAVALNETLVRMLELPKLPVAYLGIGAVALWILGIAAVYGPAWRASSIPPAEATRSV
jgi:putative ABC transport system permease protein